MSESPHPEVVILNAALEFREPERSAYLDKACASDATLREQVEALLQAHEQAKDFLEGRHVDLEFTGTERLNNSLTEKPGDKIGRYKLLQQIGEGGCGAVYMAEQEEPVRRRVALKVIKLGMDTKSVIARFEAERQALALMDHPNIAKVLDAGATETGRPYFVMELVRGIKITEFCDENKFSTADRLKLFIQVCQAIQHAHQKGIIHRDIKPSNILVTINDGVPVPKVIDFGIAKATQGRLTDKTLFTAFEQFIGTPAYMSPEQAVMTSLDVDTRSDIYSLGVLIYELITGKTPFDASELLQSGLDAMRRTICEKEPQKPSTRLSTMLDVERTTTAAHRQTESPKLIHLVRGDLDWIVMKSLEKDRARRYETANGFAADVQRHLDNEPVSASPSSGFYRLQKAVRRNKGIFTAAAVIAMVLVVGVVASTSQAIRATRAEQEARRLQQEADIGRAREIELRKKAEAGETFGEAERLYQQGKIEESRKLFNPYAAAKIYPARAAEMLNGFGNFDVSHQQWRQAITNFSFLIELGPGENQNYHALAPLFAQVHDREKYVQLCQMELAQFHGTQDPVVADRAAKDCLIVADPRIDLEAVSMMAQTAVELGKTHHYFSAFLCTRAMAEYRLGYFTNAQAFARKSLNLGETDHMASSLRVEARAIAAMAEYRLGHTEVAQDEYVICAKAAKTATLITSERLYQTRDRSWADWIIGNLLVSEAKELIEGNPGSTTVKDL